MARWDEFYRMIYRGSRGLADIEVEKGYPLGAGIFDGRYYFVYCAFVNFVVKNWKLFEPRTTRKAFESNRKTRSRNTEITASYTCVRKSRLSRENKYELYPSVSGRFVFAFDKLGNHARGVFERENQTRIDHGSIFDGIWNGEISCRIFKRFTGSGNAMTFEHESVGDDCCVWARGVGS